MAIIDQKESNITWFNAQEGALITFSREPKDDYKAVIVKGSTTYQRHCEAVIGNLVGVEFREQERYTGVAFTIQYTSDLSLCKVTIFFPSPTADGLLLSLPNVDISRPVKIYAFKGESKNPEYINTVCIFQQEDPQAETKKFITVPRYFTKDNPNGLPPMEKTVVAGKEIWGVERNKWLRAYLEEHIISQIPGPKES